jgi:hypothetical protein
LNNFKFEQFLKEVIALVVQQLVNNVHFHTTTCKLCWGGTKTCLICAKLVQTHIVLTRGVDFLQKYPYNFIRLTLVTLVLTNPYKSTCQRERIKFSKIIGYPVAPGFEQKTSQITGHTFIPLQLTTFYASA